MLVGKDRLIVSSELMFWRPSTQTICRVSFLEILTFFECNTVYTMCLNRTLKKIIQFYTTRPPPRFKF
jgi:hypothetical protein